MNMEAALQSAVTAGELIEASERLLDGARLFYGHGTDNPGDEAAALVFTVMGLDHFGSADLYLTPVTEVHREQVAAFLRQRIESREPLPYLLREAWFCGLPFFVDQRVLIPRSPIAELIADRFEPWVEPDSVQLVLEIGTGSGCIAIACAKALPLACVVATDISAPALEVAQLNIRRHDVADRVRLVRTDHAEGCSGPFDLIVSNPPYVPRSEMAELPVEFGHEPELGLVSGRDGLDSARRILQDASRLLSANGLLVLEVGSQWRMLEQAFPMLPFTWLEFEYGGLGVAVLHARELAALGACD